MSRRPTYALAVLFAALVGCEKASDSAEGGAGEGGDATGGHAGKSGASSFGGTAAGVAGAAAGHSAQGGAAAVGGGAATSGSAGAGSAGRPSAGGASGAGGTSGAGGSAGSAAGGGRAGSATLGGRGGQGASGGGSELAGAGGESDEPSSSCANPLHTVDVSRLLASEAFDPYVVTGDTANQIRESINQNRGMDYDAYTGWSLSWQFGDCAGNGLVVTVDVTYTFPEWEPSASASSELVASWETYTDALFCHEYGHAKNGLDCANEVFTALSAIDTGGDCGEQQTEADAAFGTIIDGCNQRDVEYDADTNHGVTMGAVFPP